MYGMEMQTSWIELEINCGGVGGMLVALVKQKSGRKVEVLMEGMNARQARFVSLLDLENVCLVR